MPRPKPAGSPPQVEVVRSRTHLRDRPFDASATPSRRRPTAMPSPVLQADLFGVSPLPVGLEYHAAFLTHDDEAALLDVIPELPFREAKFQQYTARRRVVRYGRIYDADNGEWRDDEPLPPWLAA